MSSNSDPRKVFWYGPAIMLILIGIAGILSVLVNYHAYTTTFSGWLEVVSGIAWGFIEIFVFILFLWIIVLFFRAMMRTPRYPRWWD